MSFKIPEIKFIGYKKLQYQKPLLTMYKVQSNIYGSINVRKPPLH